MTDSPRPLIAIGADHAGYLLKTRIKALLEADGYTVVDLGTDGPERVDYPDYAAKVSEAVGSGAAGFGVLVCGTGIGMSIAANRDPRIRCALAHDVTTARLGREHNDANVLALGARTTGEDEAMDAVRAFLDSAFEGGRHTPRVAKLGQLLKEKA
jgi:ribose 5-phosphate isomerase B